MSILSDVPPPFAWSAEETRRIGYRVNPRATRGDVERMFAAVAGELRRALARASESRP